MVKALGHLTARGVIVCVLFFLSASLAPASEPEGWIPGIEILIPGMSRSITVIQEQDFPSDFGHFVVLALGYGPLRIGLTSSTLDTEKNSTPGGLLVLTGVGISSAGIAPLLKFGQKGDTLSAYVEIGNENSPCGVVWISCWVYPLVNAVPYAYTLSLAF